jgi:hypothetical protein
MLHFRSSRWSDEEEHRNTERMGLSVLLPIRAWKSYVIQSVEPAGRAKTFHRSV